MAALSPDVTAALASLRERWGGAAPRPANEVVGALALAPAQPVEIATDAAIGPLPHVADGARREAQLGGVVPTGFAALDAILGPGGIPRDVAAALRGEGSSGKTTLALHLAAEVQGAGGIVAYVDLARSLDPVEAVARGVRLEWLVALTPGSLAEGLSMAGALLQDRAVDLLVLDLPTGIERSPMIGDPGPRGADRPAILADRLHRLAALARRAACMLLVLEPPGLPPPIRGALTESASLRLELNRRGWIRLGRDVVGQRTEVVVARNRFGPPGRRAELRILYADGGGRDRCLTQPGLLAEAPSRKPVSTHLTDASSPSLLAAPAPPPRPVTVLRAIPGRARGDRWSAVDGSRRPGREPAGPRARGPARDAARDRPPAGAGGGLPRP